MSRTQLVKVDGLKTTREIWDALGVACEGTANVRQTKVSLLVAEYKTFKMKENESIDNMFGGFQTILNGLRNLERNYKNVDHISEILICLPNCEFQKYILSVFFKVFKMFFSNVKCVKSNIKKT